MTLFGVTFGLEELLAIGATASWVIGFIALTWRGAIACGKWWGLSAVLILSLSLIHS